MIINEKNDFKPVTLNVTFETRDELLQLYHRMNLNKHIVAENSSTILYPYSKKDRISRDLFLWTVDQLNKQP